MKTFFGFGRFSSLIFPMLGVLAVVLSGCMFQDDKVAGGEDFPNTVQPVGVVAATALNSQSQYFYYTGGPKIPNVLAAADSADSVVKPQGLFKVSDLPILGDTLQNYITVTPDTVDGSTKYTIVRASPGLDGDINTHEDNTYVSYFYTRTLGTDTLEWLTLKALDSDGVFWGGPGDSGTVEMDYWGKSVSSRPLANSVSMKMLIRFYHDGDSAVLMTYSEQDQNKDGSIVNYKVALTNGDSVLSLTNDTLLLIMDQSPGTNLTLPQSHTVYSISFGPNRKSTTDDSLLGYTVENTWTRGTIRHSLFQFSANPHVVWKTVATTGTFTMATTDSAGGTQNMIGTYLKGSTDVDLRQTSNGKSSHYSVVYDSLGNVKQSTQLPN